LNERLWRILCRAGYQFRHSISPEQVPFPVCPAMRHFRLGLGVAWATRQRLFPLCEQTIEAMIQMRPQRTAPCSRVRASEVMEAKILTSRRRPAGEKRAHHVQRLRAVPLLQVRKTDGGGPVPCRLAEMRLQQLQDPIGANTYGRSEVVDCTRDWLAVVRAHVAR